MKRIHWIALGYGAVLGVLVAKCWPAALAMVALTVIWVLCAAASRADRCGDE